MSLEARLKQLSLYRKLLLGVSVFASIFAVCYGLSMRHLDEVTPPAGYIFPEAQTLHGIYSCCSSPQRNPRAHVDEQEINCATPGAAIGSSTRGADYSKSCGLQDALNGRDVLVEQRYVPILCDYCWFSLRTESIPLVTKIISNGKIYFERNNENLRRIWIDDFHKIILLNSLLAAGTVAAIFLFWINRKD